VIQQPTQPTLTPTPTRARQGGTLKVAIVILACLALAIPVIDAMAASPAPSATLFAGAPGTPDAGGHPGKGPGGDKGHGPAGPGPGKGPITIRAISGSQLSLATEDGWTRTITAGPDTTITKGGVKIGVGDLKSGDEIRFRQTRNDDGTYTISAIEVPTPRAGGEVSAIDGNNITVKEKGGSTRVITVTSSTVYMLGPSPGKKADVKVGTMIDAAGTVSGDTFTATAVKVTLPKVGGEVTGKTGNSITVTNRDGTTTVIHVTGSTTYKVKGKETGASLGDIADGDKVDAEGTLRADGSLDAVAVRGGPPKGKKPVKVPAASAAPR